MKEAVFGVIHFHSGIIGAVTNAFDKFQERNRYFGLPGGKVDEGETHLQALIRECNEEGWGGVLKFHPSPIHVQEVKGYRCFWYAMIKVNSEPQMLLNHKEVMRGIVPAMVHHTQLTDFGNDIAFSNYFRGKYENAQVIPVTNPAVIR